MAAEAPQKNGTSGARTKGDQSSDSADVRQGYKVPPEFLSNNITLASELFDVEHRIHLVELPPNECDVEDEASNSANDTNVEASSERTRKSQGFYVCQDTYEDARDAVVSRLSVDKKSTSLKTAVLFYSQHDQATTFYDGLVSRMAKELRADKLTLDLDTLEDLSWCFAQQDRSRDTGKLEEGTQLDTETIYGPFEHFFGVRSKKRWPVGQIPKQHDRAYTALSQAVSEKTQIACAQKGAQDVHVLPPLLIHARSSGYPLSKLPNMRLWARLRDFAVRLRRAGTRCAIVVTVDASHDKIPSCCEDEKCRSRYCLEGARRRKLRLDSSTLMRLDPIEVIGDSLAPADMKTCKAVRNLRRALAMIRAQHRPDPCPDTSAELLWQAIKADDCAADYLGSTLLTDAQLAKVMVGIRGQIFAAPPITEQTVRDVIVRSARRAKALSQDSKENTPFDAWKARMDKIRKETTSFENELLSSVINPEDIKSGYDQVILSENDKQTIKFLVNMSNLRARIKSSSDTLLSQITSKGAMLYGPPGTGKTHLARAVAKGSNSSMLSIDGATITSKWVGETEKYIKAVFTLATRLAPCVVFIDEVDSLFRKRTSGDRSWERSAITQFLSEMDGLAKRADNLAPFVLVATNRPMDLDDAFLRRLPQKFYLGLPDASSREQILKLFVTDDDLDASVDLNTVARLTQGYSGSDLRNLCSEAFRLWAMEQNIASPEAVETKEEEPKDPLQSISVCLTQQHFKRALQRIRPSVATSSLNDLESFRDQFGGGPHKYESPSTAEPKPVRAETPDQTSPNETVHDASRQRVKQLLDEAQVKENDYTDLTLTVLQPPRTGAQRKAAVMQYDPLPTATSIRLLWIEDLKSPTDLTEPIKCTMEFADLERPTTYAALSYTWGDPLGLHESADVATPEEWASPAHEIECNGQMVSIAENLYTAMLALRWLSTTAKRDPQSEAIPHRFRNAPGLPLWIDALCINQQDLQERNSQVSLMDRIYASSETTIMWVGGEDKLATDAIRTLVQFRQDLPPTFKVREMDLRDPESYRRMGMKPIGREAWAGVVAFYHRQYFNRAWVVQEWTRSKKAFILCGLQCLNPQIVASMLFSLHDLGWWRQIVQMTKIDYLNESGKSSSSGSRFTKPEAGLRLYSRTEPHLSMPIMQCTMTLKAHLQTMTPAERFLLGFERLQDFGITDVPDDPEFQLSGLDDKANAHYSFSSFRSSRSSDPRDKVYAFLGILGEFENSHSSLTTLKPDYTKPVAEVYIEASKAMLLGSMGLRWLALKERDSRISDLPSWVPDLSATHLSLMEGAVPYSAGVHLTASAPLVEFRHGNVLATSGYKADTVVAIFKIKQMSHFEELPSILQHVSEYTDIRQPAITSTLRPWFKTFSKRELTQSSNTGAIFATSVQTRFEVLWRTLLMDHWRCAYPAEKGKGISLIAELETTLNNAMFFVIVRDIGLGDMINQVKITHRTSLEGLGPFDRESAVHRIKKMHTVILQLQEEVPFEDRQLYTPPRWSEYEKMLEEVQGPDGQIQQTAAGMEFLQMVQGLISQDKRSSSADDSWTGTWYSGDYLFATSSGKLGMTHAKVMEGDEVWLLPDVEVPIIFRESMRVDANKREVVGESYVHGLMHGSDDAPSLAPLDIV